MDYEEFIEQLIEILHGAGEQVIPEERYLRKILAEMEQHKDSPVTAELLLTIIHNSLSVEPVKFNPEWNDLKSAWSFSENEDNSDDYLFTLNQIRYLTADMRQMEKGSVKDSLGMGLTSPNGETWYNFDIISIVDNFKNFLDDESILDEEIQDKTKWELSEIVEILMIGKSYE